MKKIWQHDKENKNMTIWEFDSLRELWLKLLSQCAWMVSSTSLQCQGLRFVQSLWADPSHVILKGESGQQWSPVSCRSKHLQMNELEMAGSHRGQGRAGSRPSNIFKWIRTDGRVSHIKEGRVSQKGRTSQKTGSRPLNKGRVSQKAAQKEGPSQKAKRHRSQDLTEGKVSQRARSHRKQGVSLIAGTHTRHGFTSETKAWFHRTQGVTCWTEA